jgi:hypothetical protein
VQGKLFFLAEQDNLSGEQIGKLTAADGNYIARPR